MVEYQQSQQKGRNAKRRRERQIRRVKRATGRSELLEQLPGLGATPIRDHGLTLKALENIAELTLEVIEESGVVSTSLEADGFKSKGHGNGIEVRLCLNNESEARSHPLSQLRELALHLGSSEIGGHGTHGLAYPPHHALAQFSPP